MKKLILALAVICVLGLSSTAQAFVLAPNTAGNITPASPSYAGTHVVVDYTKNVSYDAISGVLHQDVWLNDTGYLFQYQFIRNDGGITTNNALHRMTMTDFKGFTVDVDSYGSTGVDLAHMADLSNDGGTVGFVYENGINDRGLPFGATSGYMWIQTNAKSLTMGTTNFINGGVFTTPTYAPSAVPEPSSMLLLGMGILGLFRLGKRKTA